MQTQLDTMKWMMAIAALGGIAAGVTNYLQSQMLTSVFAYVGLHLLTAGCLLIPFALFCVLMGIEEPPFSFAWSVALVVLLPVVIAAKVTVAWVYPSHTSVLAAVASTIGAISSPFIVFGIGGVVSEAIINRRRKSEEDR